MLNPFRKSWRALLVIAGIGAIAPQPARANSIAMDFVPGPGLSKVCSAPLAPGCIGGWSFIVNSPVDVVGLGVWDEGADGLVESHDVGLWTAGGVLLTSALVTNAASSVGSTGPGQWLFTPISSLPLAPGSYVIGAAYSANDAGDPLRFNTIASTNPAISFADAQVMTGVAGLTFPTTVATNLNPGLFGANLEVIATPEPGSVLLMTTGLGTLVSYCRRRRK